MARLVLLPPYSLNEALAGRGPKIGCKMGTSDCAARLLLDAARNSTAGNQFCRQGIIPECFRMSMNHGIASRAIGSAREKCPWTVKHSRSPYDQSHHTTPPNAITTQDQQRGFQSPSRNLLLWPSGGETLAAFPPRQLPEVSKCFMLLSLLEMA